jgi:hypothetical protein
MPLTRVEQNPVTAKYAGCRNSSDATLQEIHTGWAASSPECAAAGACQVPPEP